MVYPNNAARDQFYSLSEATVTKGAHVRLQFINLSYDVGTLVRGVSHLQLYINASNLGILWTANSFDIDPDYPNSLPPSRAIAIGVRAQF